MIVILKNRRLFSKALANVFQGPPQQQDEQRKAMFAKMGGGDRSGGGGGGRGGGGGNRDVNTKGGIYRNLGRDKGSQATIIKPADVKPVLPPQPTKPPGDGLIPLERKLIGGTWDRQPSPGWGPKDGAGNTIPPPEGSHWDSRDGINYYPVPDDPNLIMRPLGGTGLLGVPANSPQGGQSKAVSSSETPAQVSDAQRAQALAALIALGDKVAQPTPFPEMSAYANQVASGVLQSKYFPQAAKDQFTKLLQRSPNPSDQQVRNALRIAQEQYGVSANVSSSIYSNKPASPTFSRGAGASKIASPSSPGPAIASNIDPNKLAFMPRISGSTYQYDPKLWKIRAQAAWDKSKNKG